MDCKDGKARLIFSCDLGNPDDHIQDGRCRKKQRVKSEIRKAHDNAWAAAFQAARAPPPPTTAPPAPTPAGQDAPVPVPPALPPAGQDQDKSPPQSLQPTPPSSSQQPPPRHTSPLSKFFLTSSLPSSPGETSQEKKAESVETRSGTRSVRFSEEAGEKETLELAPRGTDVTEEEVASSQRSPSSHQGQEAVEPKENEEREDGLPPASFWQQQLDLQVKRLEDIRKLRQASSPESVKPERPPDEDHPPPLKRN